MAFDPNMQQNAQAPQMGAPAPQQPQFPSGGMPSSNGFMGGGADGDTSQNQMPMQDTHLPPGQQPQEAANPTGAPDPQLKTIMNQMSAAIENKNLAEGMDDDDLQDIADEIYTGFKADLESCEDWLENNRDWLAMSLLVRKNKTFPWPNASNIKYPLMATASMQFSARAYPTLVPADGNIVKPRIMGYDPDGSREDKADRISKHMSFQIMHRMPRWEEDMDRLLVVASLAGICFKKTYKDHTLNTVVSRMVYPENLIVNYWAKSLEDAYRKTEIVPLTKNEYQGKVNNKEFCDIGDIGEGSAYKTNAMPAWQKPRANQAEPSAQTDCATPHIFLECHTFYDLDEDDYAEPVVITLHEPTKKVVRITARFASDAIKLDAKGKKVSYIAPLEYYTDFPFLTNPDGSIYGLGFGALLGPINEAVNTLANQLIDAGTLNNLQSGFIAKGLRIQMKETKLLPGQWMAVNSTGEDLKNGIFPLPSKEPSDVLFKLMNLLIESGNQLASVAEIFTGKMPGQNTPATTTQETVDQSMKMFTAIYKRMYDGLLSEFKKIQRINSLSPEILAEECQILNIKLDVSDYDGSEYSIIPAADPSGSSQQTQFSQLQQIGQTLLPLKVIDPREFAIRSLKLAQVASPEKLILKPQPPQPDPKAQAEVETEKIKQQTMQQKGQQDQQKGQQDLQIKQQELQMKKEIAQMEIQMKKLELQFKERELQMEEQHQQMKMQLDMVESKMGIQAKQAETQMSLQAQQQEHAMSLKTQEEEHALSLKTAKETSKQQVDHQGKMNTIKQSGAKDGGTSTK